MTIDQARLAAFVGKVLGELGSASIAPHVRIGDELGLHAAMNGAGPISAEALGRQVGTQARCVRAWLAAHASAGYIDHHAATDTFEMTPEQAALFTDPESPVSVLGGYGAGEGDPSRVAQVRPSYARHLVDDWLPALDGVVERLEDGARVADVGCGRGTSTILMARAFPRSSFVGFEYDAGSVARARAAAVEAGVAGNVRFATLSATDVPVGGYDLVTLLDRLHDIADPIGVATHLRSTLSGDGALMVVEPMAADRPQVGSTPAPGTDAGEVRLGEVLAEAGFSRVRRAAETPFNMILEARP